MFLRIPTQKSQIIPILKLISSMTNKYSTLKKSTLNTRTCYMPSWSILGGRTVATTTHIFQTVSTGSVSTIAPSVQQPDSKCVNTAISTKAPTAPTPTCFSTEMSTPLNKAIRTKYKSRNKCYRKSRSIWRQTSRSNRKSRNGPIR